MATLATSQSLTAQQINLAGTTFNAADYGFTSWAFDPVHATATYTLATGGTLYVAAVKVNPGYVTNIVYDITTAGATLTSGRSFVGLFQSGNLLGTSLDQSTAWVTTGVTTTAIANGPVLVQGGVAYVGFSFGGTTGPTLAAGATVANIGLSATASRFGTANTSLTTALPSTLAAIAALSQSPWVALS